MVRRVAFALLLSSLAAAPAASGAPGALDPGFGAGGIFTGSPFATQFDFQQQVAVDAEGRTLVAITQDDAQNGMQDTSLLVARLTAAGALDPTFAPGAATPGLEPVDFPGSSGRATRSPPPGSPRGRAGPSSCSRRSPGRTARTRASGSRG